MESKDIAVVMATEHVEDEKRGVVVETPAGRDFDIYVHKEDWKHAIKTNPKPIFWCKSLVLPFFSKTMKNLCQLHFRCIRTLRSRNVGV